jgi:hypothetical protein
LKNVQVIDAAENCTYSVYEITDDEFAVLFPNGSDIEFIEELERRIGEDAFLKFHSNLWRRPIEKIRISGIHGTMFYGLLERKQKFYPNKRFYDDVYAFTPNQRDLFKIQ